MTENVSHSDAGLTEKGHGLFYSEGLREIIGCFAQTASPPGRGLRLILPPGQQTRQGQGPLQPRP